jgi:hypothetical protein
MLMIASSPQNKGCSFMNGFLHSQEPSARTTVRRLTHVPSVRGGIGLEDTVLAEGLVDEERFDALRGRTVDFSKEELLDRLVTGWSSRTPSSASRMMYLLGR